MNEMLANVLNYAYDHNISYSMVPFDNSETPPTCDTELRLIVLNSNWYQPNEMAFQAAHECSHVLNGDRGKFKYSNFYFKSRTEGNANKRALSIVIPMYFNDLEADEANLFQFMNDLAIPSWLEDAASSSINSYYQRNLLI